MDNPLVSPVSRRDLLKLVSDTPEWRESSVLRGLKALPVTF